MIEKASTFLKPPLSEAHTFARVTTALFGTQPYDVLPNTTNTRHEINPKMLYNKAFLVPGCVAQLTLVSV